MNIDKFRFENVTCKCDFCNKEYKAYFIDGYCDDCFLKDINIAPKKTSWVKELKHLGYCVLFIMVPSTLIYCYLGAIPALVFNLSTIWGQVIDHIIYWFMRKF